jgi:hypothetical protein
MDRDKRYIVGNFHALNSKKSHNSHRHYAETPIQIEIESWAGTAVDASQRITDDEIPQQHLKENTTLAPLAFEGPGKRGRDTALDFFVENFVPGPIRIINSLRR